MSRRDKVLGFLEGNGEPFQGSVADLADELREPAGALSAAVSLLVKEKLVRRWPDSPGAVSEWLWLPSQSTPEGLIVDAEIVDDDALDPSEPVAEPEPVPARRCPNDAALADQYAENIEYEGPITVHVPDSFEVIDERPPAPAAPVLPESDGPSPMVVTLDVSPWQIRIDGRAVTNREARALVRDLRTALMVVDFPATP